MMKRILVSLLIVVSANLAWAQNYTALNGPYGGNVNDIIKLPSGKLMIATQVGVFTSANGGDLWTLSNTGIDPYTINDLEYDQSGAKVWALASSRLYSSIDEGLNWVLVANSGISSGRIIKKSPTGNLYIVGYSGTYIVSRSTTGVTWSTVFTNPTYIQDLEITGGGRVLAIVTNGVWRSDASGLNFTLLGAGNGLTPVEFSGAAKLNTGELLLHTYYEGPFISANNGDTWTSIKSNITDTYFYGHIETDGAGGIYYYNSNTSTIWKSSDKGVSWTTSNVPTFGGQNNTIYFDRFFAENSTTYYAVLNQTGIYKTSDAGSNWLRKSDGYSSINPLQLIAADNGNLLYTYGHPGGFFISIDDGASWDHFNSGTTNRVIYGFVKDGTGKLIGYGNGIITSTDNGISWTETNASQYVEQAIQVNGDLYGYESGYWDGTQTVYEYQILKSVDQGVTWTRTSTTGMQTSQFSYTLNWNDMNADQSGNVYLFIYDYSVGTYKLYKIDAATGASTLLNTSLPGVNIRHYDVFENTIRVLGLNGSSHVLYTSTDGGSTWTSKTVPYAYGLLRVINATTFYILSNSAYLSTDGGDTWTNTGSVNNYGIRDVIIPSTNFSYLAPYGSSVHKSNAQIVPPAAPSALASFGHDRNSIGLIFTDNSTSEDRFIIEASEANNLSYDSVSFTTRPSSWIRNQAVVIISSIGGVVLKSNTTYFFRVRASGSGGKSAPSNEISVTTLVDCSATSVFPQNRSWTGTTLNISGVGVFTKLNQTLTGGFGFYSIQDLPLGASVGLVPLPTDPLAVGFEENCGSTFLSSTNRYISNGNGSWDPVTNTLTLPWQTHPQYTQRNETTVYTLNASDPVPAAPLNLAAIVFLPGTVLLNWASGTFTLQFEVERSTTSGSGFTKIADVTFPTISYKDLDPTLVAGTTYYYRVLAKNATGSSGYSAEVSIIPRSNYLFLPFDNLPSRTFFRTGGGGAWGDIDGDGINDLFLPVTTDSTGQVIPPVVFKSDGTGQFTKLIIPELADESLVTRSVNIIDVNNDGLNDLLLTRSNSTDLLLTKNPDGTYTKTLLTEYTQGGLPGGNWGDYDNDGYLDFLANTGLGNGVANDVYLFNNNGDGTFTRITDGELVTDFGATRDTQWADYDNDGDQDVIVINSGTNPSTQSNSRLYQNNSDGTFTRVLGSVFESILSTDRTASWGDYDNDGHLDIFIGSQVINSTWPNRLFKNNGDGTFSEVVGSVVSEVLGTFGSAWADVDNDGDLDLFAMGTNSALYYNDGDGTFTKYATAELFNAPLLRKLYGPAMEDVDNDGFLDFHNGGFSNPDIPNIVYKNTTPASSSRKWIKFNLRGTVSNSMGVGARVYVTIGATTQIRELQAHSAHATQNSPTIHFGVGNATTINQVRIKWPSGIEQFLFNVTPNQTIIIVEDGDEPVITALTPADGATIPPGLTQLVIKFNEVPFAVASKFIKVYNTGNATPIANVAATSGIKSDSTYTYTIPAINALGNYHVTIDPFAFDDQWANSHAGIADQTTWNFIINDTPPVIINRTPVHLAQVNPGLTTIVMEFDEEVFSQAAKNVELHNTNVAIGLVKSWVATEGVKSGNSMTFTLTTPLNTVGTYWIAIDAGAFNNVFGTPHAGIASSSVWNFSIVDNIAPGISVNAPQFFRKGDASASIVVNATDNALLGQAIMSYKKIGSNAAPIATGPMAITGTSASATFTAQAAWFDDQGLEFTITVTDAAGNANANFATKYYMYMQLEGANAPVLPNHGTGGELVSYAIIAIPYVLSNTQTNILFDELGGQDKNKWRLLSYRSNPESWIDYPSTIERGKGYFLNIVDPIQINLGDATAPTNNQSSPFTINLAQGFNLIGNPYTFGISWSEVVSANSGSFDDPLVFVSGTYSTAQSIAKFQGAFVWADNATSIQIPVINSAGGRVGSNSIASRLDQPEWELLFGLKQGDVENNLGGIGMRSGALVNNKDRFDRVTAPRMFSYLEMNFHHPEYFGGRRFSKDVVPSQNEYSWDFTVDSNYDGMAELTWDNTDFGDNAKDLYLFDNGLQTPINMRTSSGYTFDPRVSSSFKVYFGNNLRYKIKPSKVLLGQAYPNPTTGEATIPYTIPEYGVEVLVKLEIFDMKGRKVANLVDEAKFGGFFTSYWDALSGDLSDGLYMYRLIVNNEIQSGKIILKK